MTDWLSRFGRPLLGATLFGVALLALRRQLEAHSLAEVEGYLRAIPNARIALAVALTVLSYGILTGYDALALHHLRRKLAYPRIALTSFIAYVFSMDLGLTIFGSSAIRYRLLSSFGLSAADVAAVVAFTTLTFWLGVVGIGGVVFSVAPVTLPDLAWLPFDTSRPLGVVLLAALAVYLGWSAFRSAPLELRGYELRVPALPTTFAQLAVSALDWVVAASVLYALLPPADGLTMIGFVAIFVGAQLLGLLSTVPAGLGVFEGVCIALLAPYLPASAVLGSLVAWRFLYYLVPIFGALLLLGGFELSRREGAGGRVREVVASWGPAIVPSVLALGTGVAGLLLLATSLLPASTSGPRFGAALGAALGAGLGVLEASHALSAVAGVGLVLFAGGLRKRVRASFHAALVLLTVGCLASLLRGHHVALAASQAAVFVALLPCAGRFDRRAAPLPGFVPPAVLGFVGLALGAAVWLGLFAHGHVDYDSRLWTTFSESGDASRALRTAGWLAVAAGLAFVWRITRPAPPPAAPASVDVLDRAAPIVAEAPEAAAHLALLGDKQILFGTDDRALLMYGVSGRSLVSMGDPIGPADERRELAWRFRELCDQYAGWPVFYEVGPTDLPTYLDLGLSLHKLGEEARVPLESFTLEGHARRGLRQTQRRMGRDGCEFAIVPQADVPPLLDRLEEISSGWLTRKSTREKGFSLGAFDRDYLARMPVAVVRREGRVVAFANVWRGGAHEELSIDLMRYDPEAPSGVMEFLFTELMLWGQTEGYRWFGLGMAPLSGLAGNRLAPAWSRIGTLLFRHGEHFYNFQGLRSYKEKFGPEWEPRYLASPGFVGLPRALVSVASLVSGGLKGVVSR